MKPITAVIVALVAFIAGMYYEREQPAKLICPYIDMHNNWRM